MRISLAKSRTDAIALIIVMIVIVVLAILAGGLAYSMKVETRLARQASVESDFEWLGRSGVELAKLVLIEQFKQTSEPYDSLKQRWAGGPGNTNDLNGGILQSISLDNVELGLGSFSVRIVDHERKFNINVADRRLLQQAMMVMGVDAGVSPEIVDSILDWIDTNNEDLTSGAETDYYEKLQPPYEAKNGPVDDMSELLLVRGVSQEIFWGTSSSNHPIAAFQMQDKYGFRRTEQPNYPFGLYDVFTALGGKLNINTAPVSALQMIPGLDTNTAQCIVQKRAGLDGQDGTGDDTPFQQVTDLGDCIPNNFSQTLSYYCYTRSSVFDVHVNCQIAGLHREYVATLYRMNQRDIKILTMYWKPAGASGSNGNTAQETSVPAE